MVEHYKTLPPPADEVLEKELFGNKHEKRDDGYGDDEEV